MQIFSLNFSPFSPVFSHFLIGVASGFLTDPVLFSIASLSIFFSNDLKRGTALGEKRIKKFVSGPKEMR